MSRFLDILDREAVGILLAITIAAVAVLPTNAAALTAFLACLVWGAVLPLVRWRTDAPISRATTRMLAISAVLVALAAGMSLAAVNPWVSFFGLIGQHTGTLLWVALLAVFSALVIRSRRGDLRRTARAVAIAAAVVGAAALMDVAGILPIPRFSAEPTGLLENSLSLAQVLVVGVAASGAWAFTRTGLERAVAVGCGLIGLVSLAFADSRGPWVGLAIGVLIFGGARFVQSRGRNVRPAAWAIGSVVVLVVAFGVLFAMLADGTPSLLENTIADLSNGRTVIWESALVQVQDSPVLGKGPEQFSAWVTWDSEPGVSLTKTGVYDPHNLLLWWLLGTGAIGIAIAVIVIGLAMERLFAALVASKGSSAVAMVAGGLVAWGVTLLFSWVSPLGALMATALGAGLVSSADRASREGGAVHGRAFATSIAIGGIAVLAGALIAASGGVTAEYDWARAVDSGSVSAAIALDAALRSNDPSLAALASTAAIQDETRAGSDPLMMLASVDPLLPMLDRDAVWHVDGAYERYQLAAARVAGLGDEAAWENAEAAIVAGKQADPASGLWDYIVAVQAAEFGFEEAAITHAEAALEYPVPSTVRTFLEELVGP